MPVANPYEESTLLYFSMKSVSIDPQNYVAEMTSFADTKHYLYKDRLEKKIKCVGEKSKSYCYRLLKHHSESIKHFKVYQNRVLKTWYTRFCNPKRNEYDKISNQLRAILNQDFYWIDTLVYDLLAEIHKSEAIVGNVLPDEGSDFRKKMYGFNVPQYYFF